MTYGLAIKTGRGYAVAEVGRAYERARELARQIDDPARVIPILIGMSAHHMVAGEIRIAHDLAVEMMALFERIGDQHLQMIGEWSLGAATFHLGRIEEARLRLDHADAMIARGATSRFDRVGGGLGVLRAEAVAELERDR